MYTFNYSFLGLCKRGECTKHYHCCKYCRVVSHCCGSWLLRHSSLAVSVCIVPERTGNNDVDCMVTEQYFQQNIQEVNYLLLLKY